MKKALFVFAILCGFLSANAQEVVVTNSRNYFYADSTGDQQKLNQFDLPMSFQQGMVFIVKEEANGRYLTDWGWIDSADTTTDTAADLHSGAFPITNMGGTLLDVTVAGNQITTRGPGLYLVGKVVENKTPAILLCSKEYGDLVLTAVKLNGKWMIYSYDPNWTGWN